MVVHAFVTTHSFDTRSSIEDDDDESTTTIHNVFETYCFGCTMVLNMFVGGSFAFDWGSFYVESLREREFFSLKPNTRVRSKVGILILFGVRLKYSVILRSNDQRLPLLYRCNIPNTASMWNRELMSYLRSWIPVRPFEYRTVYGQIALTQ